MIINGGKRGAALTALALLLCGCAFSSKEASSIGIIGGADGTTAVFVVSKFGIFPIIAVIVAAAAVIAAVVAMKNKKW